MSFGIVAGALVVGAGLTAAGSIIGGQEQAAGQERAAQTQADMFNVITQQEQPFLQSGYGATTALNDLLGLTTKDANGNSVAPTGFGGLPAGYLTQTFNPTEQQLESYPGYQFQLKQGQLATESGNTPGVGALSGAALKSLSSFNQGLAASNYNNYFNQFQTQQNNIFNRLSGIASLGQNAAGNLGNQGAQLGTGIAQAQAAAAGSQAAGTVGAFNAAGSSLSSLGILSALQGGGGGWGGGLGGALSSGTDTAGTVI